MKSDQGSAKRINMGKKKTEGGGPKSPKKKKKKDLSFLLPNPHEK
jgi:hypothetical protein